MVALLSVKDRKDLLLLALQETKGIISVACNVIGIPTGTAYRWIREDTEFKDACKQVRQDYLETLLDTAESVIEDCIVNTQDKQAAQWLLSKQGSARGYGKHVVIDLQTNAFKDLQFPDEPDSIEDWEAME